MELTERDETVLHALARSRLARTSDLVHYAFAGVRSDTAAVRLRRLYDSGHLAILPPEPGEENVYHLGPAGKSFLAQRGVDAGRVPRGGLDHHLAIVRTWVAIAALEGLRLERCLPDWELRERFLTGELPVVPDLFLLVRRGTATHALSIEVDCGTESLAALNRKMEAYRSLWGSPGGLFGWNRFGVAVACMRPVRRAAIAAAIKKVWVVPHVMWVAPESPKSALQRLLDEMEGPLAGSP